MQKTILDTQDIAGVCYNEDGEFDQTLWDCRFDDTTYTAEQLLQDAIGEYERRYHTNVDAVFMTGTQQRWNGRGAGGVMVRLRQGNVLNQLTKEFSGSDDWRMNIEDGRINMDFLDHDGGVYVTLDFVSDNKMVEIVPNNDGLSVEQYLEYNGTDYELENFVLGKRQRGYKLTKKLLSMYVD